MKRTRQGLRVVPPLDVRQPLIERAHDLNDNWDVPPNPEVGFLGRRCGRTCGSICGLARNARRHCR